MGDRSGRKAWLVLVGLALGAVGSYWLARAYRSAKRACPPYKRRAFAGARPLVREFLAFWDDPVALRSRLSNSRLCRDARFVGKLLLAVAGAQGSRGCSAAQLRHAGRIGLSQAQAEGLLAGDLESATVDEAPALYFGRRYVETEGDPDVDAVRALVAQYGERTAADVVTCVRLLAFGNQVGNTLDALVSRMLGKPSPDTTFRGELSAALAFFFGVMPLAPLLALRALLAGPRPRESADESGTED